MYFNLFFSILTLRTYLQYYKTQTEVEDVFLLYFSQNTFDFRFNLIFFCKVFHQKLAN